MTDFRPPKLYTIESVSGDIGSDLLIEFRTEAQIGRLEIEYR